MAAVLVVGAATAVRANEPVSMGYSVRDMAAQIDATVTAGFYSSGGRSISDVLAIWQVESNFDFDAIGDPQLPDRSWGIGQVRGSTAADFGISSPRSLLDPFTGASVSMRYWKWAWEYLANRLGRAPTTEEWVGSYNAGVGNVARHVESGGSAGFLPVAYVARWRAARAFL